MALDPLCPDTPALLAAAQVAAWRAGLAHHRPSALQVCRTLPPRIELAELWLGESARRPSTCPS